MLFIDGGILISFNEVQLQNAYSSINSMLSGMQKDSISFVVAKDEIPKRFTEVGILVVLQPFRRVLEAVSIMALQFSLLS